ncbi:MAG: rubredoxin [Syntrophales bacterium]|nr:rubredoxin [Syntrophales bacterium]
MALFTCEKCGSTIDTRCEPKKGAACGETGCMCKEEKPRAPKKGKK